GLHRSRALFGHDDVVFRADEGVHRAKIRLRPARVMRWRPAPPRHALHMATVIWSSGVEHRGDNRPQEVYLAYGVTRSGDRVCLEWTAGDLYDTVVFDEAITAV